MTDQKNRNLPIETDFTSPEENLEQTYEIRSNELTAQIVELVSRMSGSNEWFGDNPLEVQIIDNNDGLAYLLQIRKSNDWITVLKQVSNNPRLVKNIRLDNKNGSWKYTDPYMLKYQDYSLTELQDFHRVLQIAEELSKPKQVE